MGAIHEAIGHATAAGDFARAIELITSHWYEFLQGGRQETVAGWIDRLPPEIVARDPNLCLTKAWLGVNTAHLDDVDHWIETAEAVEEPLESGPQPPVRSGIASLRAIHRYMEGDIGAAVAAGRYALQLEGGGPPSPWRPVGCPVLGLALHWHGRSRDATSALTEAVAVASDNGNHLAAMHASGGLAAIELERGDVTAAARHAGHAARIAEANGLSEHWASSLSLAVGGQLLEERGELEEADRLIDRAADACARARALDVLP